MFYTNALTSRRPYKDPYPPEVAIDIIKRESGEALNPAVVAAFISRLDDILVISRVSCEVIDSVEQQFTWSERDQVDGTAEELSRS